MTWEWGRVGQSTTTWGRLTHQDQQALNVPPGEAVIRMAEAGVTYDLSQAVEDLMPIWHETAVQATGHHRFVMLLPTHKQPSARNLTQLRADLAQNAGTLTPDHPLLEELDWVVNRLLDVVARLHREGHGVGLLEPDSVIWFTGSDGQRHLVLPDVGFQWSGHGVLPDWLSEQNPYRVLWGNRRPSEINLQTPDVHTDLETIARLFDWVLSGFARKRFPDTEDTKHPVYAVLRDVHGHQINTAGELKENLSRPGVGLSAYFLRGRDVFKDRPKPLQWKRPALIAGVALVLLVGAGAAFWYIYTGTKPAPPGHPLCPDLPHFSKLRPLLDDFEKAHGTPTSLPEGGDDEDDPIRKAEMNDRLREALRQRDKTLTQTLAVLEKMHQVERNSTEAIRKQEEECLAKLDDLVAKDFDEIGPRLEVLLDGLANADCCRQLKDFEQRFQRFQSLTQSRKDPPWQNSVAFLKVAKGCR